MSIDRGTLLKAIYAAVDELNEQLEPERRLAKTEETLLFGDGAALDSLNLVNLVMAAEQQILEQLDLEVVLASEAAMSRRRSPYRSIGALTDYAHEIVSAELPA